MPLTEVPHQSCSFVSPPPWCALIRVSFVVWVFAFAWHKNNAEASGLTSRLTSLDLKLRHFEDCFQKLAGATGIITAQISQGLSIPRQSGCNVVGLTDVDKIVDK